MNGEFRKSKIKADGRRGEGGFWDDTSLLVIHIWNRKSKGNSF